MSCSSDPIDCRPSDNFISGSRGCGGLVDKVEILPLLLLSIMSDHIAALEGYKECEKEHDASDEEK